MAQPAIHRVKGMKIVGNVVEGAGPKHMMDSIPRRTVRSTLLWSRIATFRLLQNWENKEILCISSIYVG